MQHRRLLKYLVLLICINLLAGVSIVPAAQIEAGLIESMVLSRYHDFHPGAALANGNPQEDYAAGESPESLLNGSQDFFLVVAWPVAVLCAVNSLAFTVILLLNRVPRL
jgi:hypothetical protein